jgi:hypothetical protein
MGLHTGDAALVEGDYHGPAVNRPARLTTAGHGGQVLISGATAALVADRLPAGVELVALGEHQLRDLGRPEELYQSVDQDGSVSVKSGGQVAPARPGKVHAVDQEHRGSASYLLHSDLSTRPKSESTVDGSDVELGPHTPLGLAVAVELHPHSDCLARTTRRSIVEWQ